MNRRQRRQRGERGQRVRLRAGRRCMDCNAVPRDGIFYEHEASCPLYPQIAAVKQADTAWLLANPGQALEREVAPGERAEFQMMGLDPDDYTILVARSGGLRVRGLRRREATHDTRT